MPDAFAIASSGSSANVDDAAVEVASAYPFQDTLDRVLAAIAQAGLTHFASVDHAAGARAAGLAMPPSVVVLYGHAKGGTPIMQARPLAALDLPLRVLVREAEDGRAWLVFHPIVALLGRAQVDAALARRLEPAQALLLAAVRGAPA